MTGQRGRPPKSATQGAPSFYSPGEQAVQPEHVLSVAAQSIPVDPAMSADAMLSPHAAPPAGDERAVLDAEINRIRSLRKPLGQAFTQKLALSERKGYHRHWFNDVAGRIDEAKTNGWSHVLDKDSKPTKRVVGVGRDNAPLMAYAMEIPELFWLEDMAARHNEANSRMDEIKRSPFRAKQGAAHKSDAGKFYSPSTDPVTVSQG